MSRPDSNRIEVGVIVGAHGIRGQVKLRSFLGTPEDIATLGAITDAKGKAYKIKLHGGNDKALIASIEGITDRNAAELLKSTVLYADAANVQQSPAASIIGKAVRTADGAAYGTVINVYNFGAGDVIEIRKADSSEEMIPFRDEFIAEKNDVLIITPPEYLEAPNKHSGN